MDFRHLGRSGMLVTEIAYGNWITHGSQVEEEQATACVRAALDLGITTFDTADVYAGTRAEDVLGRALNGERREGLEIFTKVYWPTATTTPPHSTRRWRPSPTSCTPARPTTSASRSGRPRRSGPRTSWPAS